jgi:hypothetical protein
MHRLVVFLLALFLISCGGDGKSIKFPAGLYKSNCFDNGSGGSVDQTIEISSDFNTTTTIQSDYTSADCTGTGVQTPPEVDNNAALNFSNEDLGGGVSYFTAKDDQGDDEYTPFLFENGVVYLGGDVVDISNGAKNVFATFIADPKGTSEVALTKQ